MLIVGCVSAYRWLIVFQVVQDGQEGLSQGKDHRGERREESVKIVEAAQ